MKRPMIVSARLIALLALMSMASATFAAPVHIKVAGSTGDNGTTYTYRVVNGSSQPIVGVKIGFDASAGEPMLAVYPLGWTVEDGLPTSSSSAPTGWTSRVVTMEENPNVYLDWSSDAGAQFDVAPGATVSGFAIKVAQPTDGYRNATYEVVFGDATRATGLLEADDTTAPTLRVTLDPSTLWPPNGKMIAIKANISVSDDVDAHPAVRLVSITANETLESGDIDGAAFGMDDRDFRLRARRSGTQQEGRVYTVTYAATDATGNSATATTTVTVPHDQRP